MNLESLSKWSTEMADRDKLRAVVRKDTKGVPRENDVSVCFNFLSELGHRIKLVQDHTKKAEKFMSDISEFLANLEKRGVICPKDNPNPDIPVGSGQTGPAPDQEKKKWGAR